MSFIKSILLIALFVPAVTFADPATNGVYGKWFLTAVNNGAIDVTLEMVVAPSAVQVIATCHGFGQTSAATVTAQATITDTQIIVRNSVQASNSQNGLNCNASMGAGTIDYIVMNNGNVLHMSIAGSQSMDATREN